MAVMNILAFGVLVCCLAYMWKEKIVDVLPAGTCILVLVLYVLAFVRRLSGIDLIAVLFLAAVSVVLVRCGKEKRTDILRFCQKELFHPGTVAALLLFAGGTFLVRDRIATWWDDINFWATDTKALYALDGFAAKYANAAPEFGDYPPGAQLVKWWFVHMNPADFSEGLMFAGYYFCVFVFLVPLLRHLKGRNPVMILLAAVGIWAFPSVAEVFYCQGMCADLVMAVIYGAYLAAVPDEEGHKKSFYYGRLGLYLAVLVLVKSVGFLWAAFGLIFLWLYKKEELQNKNVLRPLAAVTAAPALTGVGWLVFCLCMRRIAKLTGSALSIAAGNLPVLLPGTKEKLLTAFLEAFAFWPLHRGKTRALDFSPLCLFLLICALVWVYARCGIFDKRRAKLTGIFLPVSGLVFYGINLIAHLTIFAAESQYLEPFAMVSSIERYGAPFAIGSLYLLAFAFLDHAGRSGTVLCVKKSGGKIRTVRGSAGDTGEGPVIRNAAYLLCFIFVLLSANWQEVYDGLHGYRMHGEADREAREEMITEESGRFLDVAKECPAQGGMRILYLKRASEANQWVKNAYVAFAASPVSVVFGGVDAETMNSGDIWNAMHASHAGYLYLDEMPEEALALFTPFAEKISPHTLYRIAEDGLHAELSGQ